MPEDLVDFTPELRERALEVLNKFRYGRSIFIPPSVGTADGTYGTLQVPASTGGVNWPGGSFDPETGIFYQYSKTEVTNLGLVNDPDRSDMNFIRGRPEGVSARQDALNVEGIPIIKPHGVELVRLISTKANFSGRLPMGKLRITFEIIGYLKVSTSRGRGDLDESERS
ncbi:MAG: hypothetical protein Ct9H300mP25_07590 [Acidobacteriota bacterium]|nr:MAG: hypothetical protein Ct9H300mP25_07590 [Acidobacteriota bacterium]